MVSKEQFLQYYLIDDLTFDEIAKLLNTSKTSIFRLAKKYQVKTKPKKSIPIPTKEELEKLYLVDNLTTTEISNKYDICRLTLRKWFNFYGIEARDPNKPLEIPNKEELQSLYNKDKKTITEIANLFEVNRNLVSKWFKHHKIPITLYNVSQAKQEKETLTDLYNKGKTLKEIGDIYGVDRRVIGLWFKKCGIKTDDNRTRYEELREMPLTQQQKEFLLGNMLGDGHLAKLGTMARLFVIHCEKQKDYLLWKYELLKNIISSSGLRFDSNAKYPHWEFVTICHPELLTLHKLFYRDKLKIISKELIEYLMKNMTAFSLAVLLMDDGSITDKRIAIATNGFSKNENQMLADLLYNKFGLTAKVVKHNYYKRNKVYYELVFDVENSKKLEDIVKPYILPQFNYKLPSSS